MEKILKRTLVYKGRVLRVEEKEIDFGNGRVGKWEAVYTEPAEGVSVLAIDAARNVYLVEQFKGGTETRMLHLPSGSLPEGVAPEVQAGIELQEETGYRAAKLTPLLVTYSNPGYTRAKGYLFLAEELTHDPLPIPEIEETRLIVMPFDEAIQKVLKGEITEQRTVLALLLVERMRL